MTSATQFVELLDLSRQPVAIAFSESAPEGVPHVASVAPSGCSYWKQAAEGATFFTEAADHYGCPIGAHTHGVDMPEQQVQELQGVIQTMVELQYLSMDEVPGIPRREAAFGVATYSPLAEAATEPDVVLVSGNARKMMLLAEAAHSAGVDCEANMVGRPTCAAIPAVMNSGTSAANLGCIGNRIYTELGDDELYFAFAGSQLDKITDKLASIVHANSQLEQYHQAKLN